MRNKFSVPWGLVAGIVLAVMGFALSLWPIEALAILVLVIGGSPIAAVAAGLVLDSVYGAPVGLLHYVFFPFTLGALLCNLIYMIGGRFFVDRFTQHRL